MRSSDYSLRKNINHKYNPMSFKTVWGLFFIFKLQNQFRLFVKCSNHTGSRKIKSKCSSFFHWPLVQSQPLGPKKLTVLENILPVFLLCPQNLKHTLIDVLMWCNSYSTYSSELAFFNILQPSFHAGRFNSNLLCSKDDFWWLHNIPACGHIIISYLHSIFSL